MTILGTPTYTPTPGSGFPRPYVAGIRFRFGAGVTFAQADEQFFITDSLHPWVHIVCNFLPNLWPWSTAGYTIDHVIVDWWLLLDPDPTPQPLNFGVEVLFDSTTFNYWLGVGVIGWTTEYDFTLPPAPPTYWRFHS